MIKIGIEINNILRDLDKQLIKYYKKDIKPSFDESTVGTNRLIDFLEFDTKKSKNDFLYIDYPYEIFGCAPTCEKNLANTLNGWLYDLSNEEEYYQVMLFSGDEDALTIQSTYFFLSKIGCRVREVKFPTDTVSIWDDCDVVVTNNESIISVKPENKKLILIEKPYNEYLKDSCDLIYQSLEEMIEDKDLLKKIKE